MPDLTKIPKAHKCSCALAQLLGLYRGRVMACSTVSGRRQTLRRGCGMKFLSTRLSGWGYDPKFSPVYFFCSLHPNLFLFHMFAHTPVP